MGPGVGARSPQDDGPAAEIKEHFGGFSLVECADLDEALSWAATLPSATEGCHSTAESAQATDWPQIAALYGELARFEPTPVVIGNQAVAVAMAQGPSAGLAMLDRLADDGRLDRWPQLHVARAESLARLGRCEAAQAAYQSALAAAELPAAERDFIARRLAELTAT